MRKQIRKCPGLGGEWQIPLLLMLLKSSPLSATLIPGSGQAGWVYLVPMAIHPPWLPKDVPRLSRVEQTLRVEASVKISGDVCPAATPHLPQGTRAIRGMGWAKWALAWAGWAGRHGATHLGNAESWRSGTDVVQVLPVHSGSRAPCKGWHVMCVVRWAEGAAVDFSGARNTSEIGPSLSPGVSCRSEL